MTGKFHACPHTGRWQTDQSLWPLHLWHPRLARLPLHPRDLRLRDPLLRELHLWDLHQHKEVYWRLTLDALPTAARLHHVDPCICGEPSPNWFHHFWSCPVAAGLLAVLSNHLESRGMLPTLLLPLHVLLAQPPSSRLHVGIWRVVCLAAICALDHVRRTACAIALAGVPSQAASAPASELTMLSVQ